MVLAVQRGHEDALLPHSVTSSHPVHTILLEAVQSLQAIETLSPVQYVKELLQVVTSLHPVHLLAVVVHLLAVVVHALAVVVHWDTVELHCV